MIRRVRLALRTLLALVIVGGLGAGAWFVWGFVESLNEGIGSIDLEDDSVGYSPSSTEPATTTTTTTTLPPRDLEVLVVTPEGDPAGSGIEIWLWEVDEDGEPGEVSTAATDEPGTAHWLDIEATQIEVMVSTTCIAESAECFVSPDRGFEAVTLQPGLTSVQLAVERYDLNRTTTGVLPGNEVWASEVTLTGSVVIPAGQTLVIASGTVVTFAGTDDKAYTASIEPLDKPDGIAVWSEGLVVVEGTATAPVRFGPDTEDGHWAGLFDSFDASAFESVGGREIRLFEGSQVAGALISSRSITIAPGVEFDHNIVESDNTTAEMGGARLHHNRLTGAGQSDCLRLDGLSGHELHNNIFIECPIIAESRPEEQPVEDDPLPLVIENNVFVTSAPMSSPAVTIDNEFVAVKRREPDPEQFDTVQVFFRNNIVHGPWPEGVYLGARPLNIGSVFKNNAFFGLDPDPLYPFDPDNNYTYGGRLDRSGLFSLTGVTALNFAWSDRISRGWSPGARGADVYEYVEFVDLEGDFRLAPISPAIDAGHANIRDADGGPSDIGAYGGPGSEDWN